MSTCACWAAGPSSFGHISFPFLDVPCRNLSVLAGPRKAFTNPADIRSLRYGYSSLPLIVVFLGFHAHICLGAGPEAPTFRVESLRKTVCGVTLWSAAGKSCRSIFAENWSHGHTVASWSHCSILYKREFDRKRQQKVVYVFFFCVCWTRAKSR